MADSSDFHVPLTSDSTLIRKAFVKSQKLQIQVVEEPVFSHLMDLYEECFKLEGRPSPKAAWEVYRRSVEKFATASEYFAFRATLLNTILEKIRGTDAYKRLSNDQMSQFAVSNKYPKAEIYQEKNIGKPLISIDIRQANFAAMRTYDSELVQGASSYEEFIRQFTDDEHLIGSRLFRQLIFGNLLPTKQGTIQRFLIQRELAKLQAALGQEQIQVVGSTNDELIIEPPSNPAAFQVLDHSLVRVTSVIMDQVILEKPRKGKEVYFTIVHLFNPATSGFEFYRRELRCLPANIAPQVYRQVYLNEQIHQDDRWSYSEEYLCHVVEVRVLSKHLIEHV